MSRLAVRLREALSGLERRDPTRLPAPHRLGVAAAFVVLAGLIQWAAMPAPTPTAFLLFLVAVGLSGLLAGRGPALVAVALSALAGNILFIEPVGLIKLEGAGFVSTLFFAPIGVLLAILAAETKMAKVGALEAVEALRRSEERSRTALDAMPEPVVICDRGGMIEYANAPMAALLGIGRDALRGRDIAQVLKPHAIAVIEEPLRRAVETGQRQAFTYRSPPGVTPRVHVKIDLVLIFGQGRQVVQVLAVAWDLTERTLAEEELRRSETIIEQAGEMARVGAWSVEVVDARNLASSTLRWSSQLFRILGYEPGAREPSWALLMERTHPEDRVPLELEIFESMEARRPYRLDHRIVRPDGVERVVSEYGRWEYDAEGRPERIVGAMQDITEQRRVEEALREADRRKDEFLGVLSHELRNPLAPIRNSVYLLAKNPALDERGRRAVAIIDRQSHHLSKMVDDLLDVTRIARGKVQLRREPLDLCVLVRRAVEDLRSLLESHLLETQLPPGEVWVDGDPTRLSQIVGNLLANSAKFTSAGGRVVVALSERGGRAVLEVRDDGIGIEPQTLARLFEPFIQADRSLDRSKGGLGLGLSLVKGLVEMHGGSVLARSEGLGRGSSFTVELPLLERRPDAANGPQQPPQPEQPMPGRRILIVEDNRDAADSLREALEAWGHSVSVANSGVEGLTLARELRPEVVLCDVGLPGELDGYAVARALRGDAGKAALLVAVSGYAQPEDLRRAREAGFDSHLAKPPDLAELRLLLARSA